MSGMSSKKEAQDAFVSQMDNFAFEHTNNENESSAHPLLTQPELSASNMTPNEALNLDVSNILGDDGRVTAGGSIDFPGVLWDRTEALLDVYSRRISTLERLYVFYREKAILDEHYSRSIGQLADRMKLPTTENADGILTKSLSHFAQMHKSLAIQQEVVARRVTMNVADKLRVYCSSEQAEYELFKKQFTDARKAFEAAIVQSANSRAQAFSASAASIAARNKVKIAARCLAENHNQGSNGVNGSKKVNGKESSDQDLDQGGDELSDSTSKSSSSSHSSSSPTGPMLDISIEQFENLQRHAALSDTRARAADEAYQQDLNQAIELRVAHDAAIAEINASIQKKLSTRVVVASRATTTHTRLMRAHAQLAADTLSAGYSTLLGHTDGDVSDADESSVKTPLLTSIEEELESICKQLETDGAPEPYPCYDVPPGHPDEALLSHEAKNMMVSDEKVSSQDSKHAPSDAIDQDERRYVAFAASEAAKAHKEAQAMAQRYASRGLSFGSKDGVTNVDVFAALDTIGSAALDTAKAVQDALSNVLSFSSSSSSNERVDVNGGSSSSHNNKTSKNQSGERLVESSLDADSDNDEFSDSIEQWNVEVSENSPSQLANPNANVNAGPTSTDSTKAPHSSSSSSSSNAAREHVIKEISQLVERALESSHGGQNILTDDDITYARSLFSTNDGRNACVFVLNRLRKQHKIEYAKSGIEALSKLLHVFLDAASNISSSPSSSSSDLSSLSTSTSASASMTKGTNMQFHLYPIQLVMILSQTLYTINEEKDTSDAKGIHVDHDHDNPSKAASLGSSNRRYLQEWIRGHAVFKSMRFWNEAFLDAFTRQIRKHMEVVEQQQHEQEQQEQQEEQLKQQQQQQQKQKNDDHKHNQVDHLNGNSAVSSTHATSQETSSSSSGSSFISMFTPTYLLQSLGLSQNEPQDVIERRERLRVQQQALEEAKQEIACALLATYATQMHDYLIPTQYIRAFMNKIAINMGLSKKHIDILKQTLSFLP